MTDLTALIDRVRTGTGEDRELDADVMVALGYRPSYNDFWCNHDDKIRVRAHLTHLTTSLDAVVRLVEEKRPGWATHYLYHAIQWLSAAKRGPRDVPVEELPRAVLLALLLALQAQEAEGT